MRWWCVCLGEWTNKDMEWFVQDGMGVRVPLKLFGAATILCCRCLRGKGIFTPTGSRLPPAGGSGCGRTVPAHWLSM